MKKKNTHHFSVEDLIRSEFRKPVSRGTIGKDADGLLWAYGIILKDSRYCVEVISIDLETHESKHVIDKESSYELREDAAAYISGLIKEILTIAAPVATAAAL